MPTTPEQEAARDAHSALVRELFPRNAGRSGPVVDAICIYQWNWDLVREARSRRVPTDRDNRRHLTIARRRLVALEPLHGLPPAALRQVLRRVRASFLAL